MPVFRLLAAGVAAEVQSLTRAGSFAGVPNESVEVVAAHCIIILTFAQVVEVFLLMELGMLLVVCFLQFILRCNAVSMQTVASRRKVASRMLALVVPFAILRARGWGLDVTQVTIHGNALSDFRDPVLVVMFAMVAVSGKG